MVSDMIKQRLEFIDTLIKYAYTDPLQYALRCETYNNTALHNYMTYGE